MTFEPLNLLAQMDGEDAAAAAAGAAAAGAAGVGMLINLAIVVVGIVAQWKIFTKAGKPGWAAIIPIYNVVVWLEIVGRPIWWIVLCLIPCVNIVVLIIFLFDFFCIYFSI